MRASILSRNVFRCRIIISSYRNPILIIGENPIWSKKITVFSEL